MTMEQYDAIVVGGGPAGSAGATKLVAGGAKVLVLDRETFPRTKLCAGWITPEVVQDLHLNVADYPHRFNTFDNIVVHIGRLRFSLATPQHSIRRHEFDHHLLQTSAANVVRHQVRHIHRQADGYYVLDDNYRCQYLIGAGGTRCPVYKTFFREANPRSKILQVATYEHEFPYQWSDARCHLWFFDHGLPGYAWYVPKANGYLNCGIGGMVEKLKARREDIKSHWRYFTTMLHRNGFVDGVDFAPKGYSYYLRGNVSVVQMDNAFITGDAAGLATRDLCEGIGPAIRSGQRAAATVLTGCEYRLSDLLAFSSDYRPIRWLLEYMFINRKMKALASA